MSSKDMILGRVRAMGKCLVYGYIEGFLVEKLGARGDVRVEMHVRCMGMHVLGMVNAQ